MSVYGFNDGKGKVNISTTKKCKIEKIPLIEPPTTDGTYTLQCVVSGGVPSYSWV